MLVASVLVPGAAAAVTNDRPAAQGEAYAGTHVSFDAQSNAIVDYQVDGATVFDRMAVQAQSNSKAQAGLSAGAGLDAVTKIAGAAVSMGATTETSAAVSFDSGATMEAHDNGHGTLVLRSGGENQYVTTNVSSAASVNSESSEKVIVTTEEGTETAVLVTGDGSVDVNAKGNVTAELGSDSELVVRSYGESRSEADKKQEELITSGTAAAQVYLTGTAEGGSQAAADVVDYGQETTVEVTSRSQGTVEMTAERSASEGKVIITSVSESAFESTEDVQVMVDGEAAAKASSYSALQAAADGGENSKYMVTQSSSAEASADVLVAVNHFSERSVTMTDGQSSSDGADGGSDGSDGSSGDTGGDQTTTGGAGPGFSVVVGLLALLAAAFVAMRRA